MTPIESRRWPILAFCIAASSLLCLSQRAEAGPKKEQVAVYIPKAKTGKCMTDGVPSQVFKSAVSYKVKSAKKQAREACEAAHGKPVWKKCAIKSFSFPVDRPAHMTILRATTPCPDGTKRTTYGIGFGFSVAGSGGEAKAELARRNWNWRKKKHGFSVVKSSPVAPRKNKDAKAQRKATAVCNGTATTLAATKLLDKKRFGGLQWTLASKANFILTRDELHAAQAAYDAAPRGELFAHLFRPAFPGTDGMRLTLGGVRQALQQKRCVVENDGRALADLFFTTANALNPNKSPAN